MIRRSWRIRSPDAAGSLKFVEHSNSYCNIQMAALELSPVFLPRLISIIEYRLTRQGSAPQCIMTVS